MDLIIAAAIAVLAAIISILAAVFTKKTKKKIFVYAITGLVLGLIAGYLLAPLVISFL